MLGLGDVMVGRRCSSPAVGAVNEAQRGGQWPDGKEGWEPAMTWGLRAGELTALNLCDAPHSLWSLLQPHGFRLTAAGGWLRKEWQVATKWGCAVFNL